MNEYLHHSIVEMVEEEYEAAKSYEQFKRWYNDAKKSKKLYDLDEMMDELGLNEQL